MIDGQLQLAALIDQTFGLAVILSLKRNSPQRTILLHKFSQMHASSERFFFQAIANKIIKPASPKEALPERPFSAGLWPATQEVVAAGLAPPSCHMRE